MFKIINDGKLPTRATKHSAGVDVYANEDITIGAGETAIVGLGIAIDENEINRIVSQFFYYDANNDLDFAGCRDVFMSAHYLQLSLRSSLGAKGLILPNGIGIIDMDYKDEIKMIIHNPLKSEREVYQNGYDELDRFHIKKGDRIGQLMLMEHKGHLLGIESEKERDGGLGSTGDN